MGPIFGRILAFSPTLILVVFALFPSPGERKLCAKCRCSFWMTNGDIFLAVTNRSFFFWNFSWQKVFLLNHSVKVTRQKAVKKCSRKYQKYSYDSFKNNRNSWLKSAVFSYLFGKKRNNMIKKKRANLYWSQKVHPLLFITERDQFLILFGLFS